METKPPKYMKPGNRSTGGSGIDRGAYAETQMKLGELTPPGLVSYPKGPAEVSHGPSAPTAASAAFDTSQVQIKPMSE